jgi:K+-transporting ATPase ATPase C chain
MSLSRQSVAALRLLLVMTVLLGIGYPAVVWGVGRIAFPHQAAGSIVRVDGKVVGSSLLGQDFTAADVFHSRPSASSYSGDTSGGSNLAASDPAQAKAIAARKAALVKDGDLPADGIAPADALTASASGFDPDISPAYAMDQVPRVAKATGLSDAAVSRLVTEHTSGRVLGFLGEPRVNVLALNTALAAARN